MNIFRYIIYTIIVIAISMVMVWFFAIPDDLIRLKIEETLSGLENSKIRVSVEDLSKGLFFSVHANSIQLEIKDKPAFRITEVRGRINPLFIIKKQLAFSIKGLMGSGSVSGLFRFPGGGSLRVENADLNSIPYLKSLGIKSNGYISAHIKVIDSTAKVVFEIPDLSIQEYNETASPILSTFHRTQGVMTIVNDNIQVNSLGLEGEKGYARVKGEVRGGNMNLTLELMPSAGEVTPVELTLIGRYQKSPGYYVIPIKGPLF